MTDGCPPTREPPTMPSAARLIEITLIPEDTLPRLLLSRSIAFPVPPSHIRRWLGCLTLLGTFVCS